MQTRCLIVDKMHPGIEDLLLQAGLQADYRPTISRQEIKDIIANYQGLIIRSKTYVNEDLLQTATRLKFVARAGSGIDNLDARWLQNNNINIINAPEGNRDAVGEHTTGLILSLLHNLHQAHQQVTQGIWDREGNRGTELSTKTVGIIGYGNMGMAVAKRLSALGARVIAYDKYHPIFTTHYAQSVSLHQLKEETDILSLHVPLAKDTQNMTSGNFFTEFKKNLIFINTSRGEVAPLESISQALEAGKITKAALDVLENEKLKSLTPNQLKNFNYLKSSGKVIFTPHVAGWTTESYVKLNKVLVKKISALF